MCKNEQLVSIGIFVVLCSAGAIVFAMEVSFNNADIAAIMLKPAQVRVEAAYQAALKATLKNVKEAEAQAKLVQEATNLGKKLDVKA